MEDNDENVAFSNYIFKECLLEFNENPNLQTLRIIEPDELQRRLLYLKSEIPINQSIEPKILNFISYIEKNIKYYKGINTIW